MTATLVEEKKKLEQKKARLQAQEMILKNKEKKRRDYNYMEIGKLSGKAEIDHLNFHTLFGAFLHLKNMMFRNPDVLDIWEKKGKEIIDAELKQKQGVILVMKEETDTEMKKALRNQGLKWNTFRREWFGLVDDIDALKKLLGAKQYTIKPVDIQ